MSTPPTPPPKRSTPAPASKSTTRATNGGAGINPVTQGITKTSAGGLPEVEVRRNSATGVDNDDWEDEIVIGRSRGRPPTHSILHHRNGQGSREHSVESAPADPSRNTARTPHTVTFQDGGSRQGSEKGSSHRGSQTYKELLTRQLIGQTPTPARVAESPSQSRRPGGSHFTPTFLPPDPSLLDDALEESGLSRPESPEKYSFGFQSSISNTAMENRRDDSGDADQSAPNSAVADKNPAQLPMPGSTSTRVSTFRSETVPPNKSNPRSPLASPTSNPNPSRRRDKPSQGEPRTNAMAASSNPLHTREPTAASTQPLPGSNPPSQFLTADANTLGENQKRRAQYAIEQVKGQQTNAEAGPSRSGVRPPPHREKEISPKQHQRYGNAHGSPGHRRRKRRPDIPFRPMDPYAFPSNRKKSPIPPFVGAVRWAVEAFEDAIGFGTDDGDESSKSSKGSKNDEKGKGRENGENIPMEETSSLGRRRGRDVLAPVVGAIGASDAIQRTHERAEEIRREEARRRRQIEELKEDSADIERAMDREEDRERQHGLPTVPRQSPTRPPGPLGHLQDGTESAPPGRLPVAGRHGAEGTVGTLSPPKASPDNRPASDPGSPRKKFSPLSLTNILPSGWGSRIPKISTPVREVEKQVELTLRQWINLATVQLYRHVLLRLPSLYFNRVGRVLTEAQISKRDVEYLAAKSVDNPDGIEAQILNKRSPYRGFGGVEGLDGDEQVPLLGQHDSNSPSPHMDFQTLVQNYDYYHSDAEGASLFKGGSMMEAGGNQPLDPSLKATMKRLERFRIEWETFVDGLVKEWKTLNVVSALLLSALLTIFQIDEAKDEPVTRTAALLSLISAFLSLMFGGIYIIRFSTMRTMRKATRWVEEAQKEKQKIFWNIWILLSMPVTWLAYSLIFFCISLIAFVWTSGTGGDDNPVYSEKSGVVLGPRIAITTLFFVGFVYFCLALNTFRVWSGATVGGNDGGTEPRRSDDAFGQTPDQTPLINFGGKAALPPEGGTATAGVVGSGRPMIGERDGLKELNNVNRPTETGQQRIREIARGLSDGSQGSILGLDFTPPLRPPGAVSDVATITETPPTVPSLALPQDYSTGIPITTVTQPTPLTAIDPAMHSSDPRSTPLPLEPSRPFQRREQTEDLDQPLPPPPNAPLPPIREVTEFGSLSRNGRPLDANAGISSEMVVPSNAATEGGGGNGNGREAREEENGEKRGLLGRLGIRR